MSRGGGIQGAPELLKAVRGGRLFLAFFIGSLLALWGGRAALSFYVDILWFDSEGYIDVFWTRRLWQWGVALASVAVTAALVYLNLARVADTFGGIQVKRQFGNLEISEQIPRRFIRGGLVGISLLLSLWLAAAISGEAGLALLLMVRSAAWGVADPIFGHDLSFYAFTLPVINGVLTYALILSFMLFALSAAGYGATGSARWIRNRLQIDPTARVHLAALLGTFLVLLGIRFWLARYFLLLDGNSGVQGIFGFADANARLPGFAILAVVSAAAGIITVWGGMRRRMAPIVGALATLAIALLLVGEAFPALVQRFRVEPNELAAETEYIEHNMAATRAGFGLGDIRRERYDYRLPQAGDAGEAFAQLDRMPIWTGNTLYTTYSAIEARFRYYDFPVVAFDRYRTERGLEPVAISVREVDPGGIPDPNWQNRHIRERFIAGVGVVASNAARQTRDGRPPLFLRGIPPEFIPGPGVPDVELRHPSVFFGSRQQLYAVVNPGDDAFLNPEGEPGVAGVDFPEGILLDSPLRTVAFATRFADANLLFASEVSSTSRFVFRRNVLTRIREVAPFVTVSANPYPVIAEGRVHWIVDGFTTTSWFPLASSYEVAGRRARYMRNSVKVTVDAVTGEINLYAADTPEAPDPLLAAYRAAFPTLFRELDEMPELLRDHLRYPSELLDLQSVVLLQYHQETAPVFHGQQDVWNLSTQLSQDLRAVPYRPQYGVFRLPGEEEPDFFLTNVFVPAGRQNLAGVLIARWHHERSGELVLYDIPVELQVPGPRQIEALVEQDPLISEQFALWRQSGSQVWTGHLHVVPVGQTLFYMEPIFLAAQADAIPELRRFVVSDGQRVVMETSLAGAIQMLIAALDPAAAVADLPSFADPTDAADPGEARERMAALGSTEALELLERAEQRLRNGDWQGFGAALAELRELLEQLAGGAEATPPPPPGG
jgi:uncharacterized protein